MNQALQEQPAAKAPDHHEYSPGLEGVIAGESAICQVDQGEAVLRYRGYAIGDLADRSSFEEVAYLLLYGHLPTGTELEEFSARLADNRQLPEHVRQFVESLRPGMHPMDVLRTGISLLGLSDPDAQDGSRAANLRKSVRLLAQIPRLVADSYHVMAGQQPARSHQQGTFAEHLLNLIAGHTPGEVGMAMTRLTEPEPPPIACAFCMGIATSIKASIVMTKSLLGPNLFMAILLILLDCVVSNLLLPVKWN